MKMNRTVTKKMIFGYKWRMQSNWCLKFWILVAIKRVTKYVRIFLRIHCVVNFLSRHFYKSGGGRGGGEKVLVHDRRKSWAIPMEMMNSSIKLDLNYKKWIPR